MDYKNLINHASFSEISEELSSLVTSQDSNSLDLIAGFLTHYASDTFAKQAIPRQACRALIQKGPTGISKLVSLAESIDGYIYPSIIINAIWHASQGELPPHIFPYDTEHPILDRSIDEETILAAKEAFHDFIITCIDDFDLFEKLVGALRQQSIYSQDTAVVNAMRYAFTESSIQITKRKIDEFANLVKSSKREEEYQTFLKENPVFINPLASIVFDKQKLGDDLITDFAIKTLDNKYVLVEIEKPHDSIFNKKGDFTASFTHAYGQVLDFLSWVDENIAYAQKKLPGINLPSGMLIMGRSTELSTKEKRKLDYFNQSNPRITIYTYDDILSSSSQLYNNIIGSNNNR